MLKNRSTELCGAQRSPWTMASSPISPALAESRGDELCRDRADVLIVIPPIQRAGNRRAKGLNQLIFFDAI
jgi:hypothetical protein